MFKVVSRFLWVLVLLGAGGCATKNRPTLEDGPASTAAPTTTATTVATVATTTPDQRLANPNTAAGFLYEAWRKGDRTTALLGATAAAVDALFAKPFMASVLRGCDEPSSVGSDCLYRYGNGLLRMHITGSAETGFRVETVEFS